ncbi:hypothetical protein ElyMa_002769400 [Elysia marginata]|uniref:Down syndrome cell adhesion molecule C-terminal domain-containing protein n=1 Tax=Elysia marginata TaxID=1093978 RepID=A0AAV4HP11_9GAST|nr:hypothetical protein ElyMa_002769400 [Elysia marginata]
MADESVYVAIAIACVVALLVLAILIIYCMKRQQDKMNERIVRERRRREERQRRNFMRAQMVQPPSYEVSSRGVHQPTYPVEREIPWSPPPEYKELATPVPSLRQNQTVGIGGVHDRPMSNGYPPEYSEISSISRNVPPVFTYMPPGVSPLASNTAPIVSSNNRNMHANQNARLLHRSDSAIQVQVTPRTVLPDVVTSATGRSGSDRTNSTNYLAGEDARVNSIHAHPSTNNNRPAHNHDRSNFDPTFGRSPGPDSSGAAQTQIAQESYRHHGNTQWRLGSRPAGTQNEATRSSAEASGPNSRSKNQVTSQLQDLSLI